MNRCLLSLLYKRSSFFRLHDHIPCEIHFWACSSTCAAFMSTIFRGQFFLVPVEHDNGMSIYSGDVVCVLPTLYTMSVVSRCNGIRCTRDPPSNTVGSTTSLGINTQISYASAGLLAGLITYLAS